LTRAIRRWTHATIHTQRNDRSNLPVRINNQPNNGRSDKKRDRQAAERGTKAPWCLHKKDCCQEMSVLLLEDLAVLGVKLFRGIAYVTTRASPQ